MHAFYPFIEYEKRFTRFAAKGGSGKKKCRVIRYAARRDACIFSHYRAILAEKYEARLGDAGISGCVLGYRRIPVSIGSGNKCNIHFAKDAFDEIRKFGNCHVYALDISKFFDNLDHVFLKTVWADLLGSNLLPPDHYQVFKAVTRFSCINKLKVYEALDFIGKSEGQSNKPKGYLVERSEIPLQLCTPDDFRTKLAHLIQTNKNLFGIPQGAAISDVLANLYMFDFDRSLSSWAAERGGLYFRYSDDILVITPGPVDYWDECLNAADNLLMQQGYHRLEIQREKCCAYRVAEKQRDGIVRQTLALIHEKGCNNGLEYLGLRYDGINVYLRESTRAKFNRSIVRECKRSARSHVQQNPHLAMSQLQQTLNIDRVLRRVGRVQDFENVASTYKRWTFWSYAKRSATILGEDGWKIYRQVAGYRSFARRRLTLELQAVVNRSQKRSNTAPHQNP